MKVPNSTISTIAIKNSSTNEIRQERFNYLEKELNKYNLQKTRVKIINSPYPQGIAYNKKKTITLSDSLLDHENEDLFKTLVVHEIGHLKEKMITPIIIMILVDISFISGLIFSLIAIEFGISGIPYFLILNMLLVIIPFFLFRYQIWKKEYNAEYFAKSSLGEEIWLFGREYEINQFNHILKYMKFLKLSQMYPLPYLLVQLVYNAKVKVK